MRRALGALCVIAGFIFLLFGAGWHVFSGEILRIDKEFLRGDWSVTVASIERLRARPWFSAVRIFPGIADDLGMKEAYARYRFGDRSGAAKAFREFAHSQKHGSSALFNAATIDLSPETFEGAIRDYEEVLEKNPVHTKAQKNLEILRQIEREQQEAMGDGDKDKDGKGDGKEDRAKKKKRSRTKDKLEYRNGDSESSGASPSLRY